MNRVFTLLTLVIVLLSCKKTTDKIEEEVTYKLVEKQDKVFKLDNETSYNRIKPYLKKLNDSLFFIFMNRSNNQFYLYDYTTGKLKNKIQVFKEGPNAVKGNFFSYYIHNLDSIFISPWHDVKYLINKDGEVVNKTKIKEKSEHIFENEKLYFDGATIFKHGKLLTGRRITVAKLNASNPLRASFNFDEGIFEDAYLEEKVIVPGYDKYTALLIEMAKSNGVSNMEKFVVGQEKQLFASSQISDSIYEFNKGQLVNVYYAGDSNIKTADYLAYHNKTVVETSGNSVSIFPSVEQPPHYTAMLMDENREWIYRILIHGTRDSKGNNDFRDSEIIGASLIAFNVEHKSSSVFNIPTDKVLVNTFSGGSYFATKEGIHFPIKEQEIESEKRYKVFKIE